MEQMNELNDSCFDDQIMWQFSPSKENMLFYQLKYVSIAPVICLLTGLILALTGVIVWIGLVLFGGVAVFTFFLAYFILSRQNGQVVYTITETKIIIYPLMCIAEFANIKKIKNCHSLLNKNVGTIKFKVKNRLSLDYKFVKIDDVDSVYDLLISLWGKNK